MNKSCNLIPAFWKVKSVRNETSDCFSLRLQTPADYRFLPGQFNMLYLFGVGEAPISISSDPQLEGELVHSIRAVGKVTHALSRIQAGDSIGVRGPFGTTWPLEQALGKDILIIVGGIGLAPLRPLIFQILAQRDRFKRVHLLYGARTPKDLLFTEQWDEWRSGIEIHCTVDRPLPGWTGQVGVVPKLIGSVPFDPGNTTAFVCGPEVMMRYTLEELLGRGLLQENLYVSLERNMKCAQGFCGHCQIGPYFVCKDGPVFPYSQIEPFLHIRGV